MSSPINEKKNQIKDFVHYIALSYPLNIAGLYFNFTFYFLTLNLVIAFINMAVVCCNIDIS